MAGHKCDPAQHDDRDDECVSASLSAIKQHIENHKTYHIIPNKQVELLYVCVKPERASPFIFFLLLMRLCEPQPDKGRDNQSQFTFLFLS